MELAYYPGCSLHSTGQEFDLSVRAVFERLGVGLTELEDWSCCGASSAHALDPDLGVLLPARNLALANRTGMDVLMPCAACYNRHAVAAAHLRDDPDMRARADVLFGTSAWDESKARPVLAVLCQDLPRRDLLANVVRPLNGMPVVSYYGCLLLRPAGILQSEDPEHPVMMDELLSDLGAEPRRWSYASECCGGGLSLTRPPTVRRLVQRLTGAAREAGAQVIVTSCPLCQVNLEMRQSGERIPVLYVTELVATALGVSSPGWWKKHLIDPAPVLRRYALAD
ncbi:MAG: CoB--CoM heterodisulfide reductase iron-sulfur subunit B family protein [Anaerolineales bacterium]|nr:CoB--CoM heterodisulfide reductase iron-sulfur subunit B family protein [Anaerolineales bacterium]